MNSLLTPRALLASATSFSKFISLSVARQAALRGLAAGLLATTLAGCGHQPDAATSAPAVPAPALTTAPAVAPAPVAPTPTPAPAPAPTKEVAKPKQARALPAPPPAAAPVVAEEAPAASAPAPEAAPAAPATRTQAGRVLDENGRPLIGATVMLRGSTKGTSTDANGSYTLEVPTGENTFVIGYGGYEDETATSHDGQPINVTLLPTPGSKTKSRRMRR